MSAVALDRPGHFVTASHAGRKYQAWVPAPLPPVLEFDAELARRLGDAAGALGELAGTGRNLANPHLLLSPFLRREAVLSSRIEGTHATIADLYAFEAAQLPENGATAASREGHGDVREVMNYVDALNRGLEIIRQEEPVSLALLEELHAHLMRDVRGRELTPGQFRNGQNGIGPPGATLQTAVYVPPPPIQMRRALRELEAYIRRDDDSNHRLVRLALIHYQFEAIHPFNDGNGRVGRLLISLLIAHWDLLSLPLLYLSAYLEQNRREYYERLQAVTEAGEWREWILFFLNGIAEQSADAAARAKRLHDLRESLQERAAAARLPSLATRLAGRLVEQPVITISRAAELLGVSYHNARRQVHRLAEIGVLRPYGGGGPRELYAAAEVMAAVER